MFPVQLTNMLSKYKDLCGTVFGLLGSFRELRAKCDALGYTLPLTPAASVAPGPAMAGVTWPAPGDLSHIQNPNQFLAMVASLVALEASLGTPVTYTNAAGVAGTAALPATAIATVAG